MFVLSLHGGGGSGGGSVGSSLFCCMINAPKTNFSSAIALFNTRTASAQRICRTERVLHSINTEYMCMLLFVLVCNWPSENGHQLYLIVLRESDIHILNAYICARLGSGRGRARPSADGVVLCPSAETKTASVVFCTLSPICSGRACERWKLFMEFNDTVIFSGISREPAENINNRLENCVHE